MSVLFPSHIWYVHAMLELEHTINKYMPCPMEQAIVDKYNLVMEYFQ